jgi:stage V sporulation protein G
MIEVARLYRFEDNGSSLKAFADITVGDVLIKGIRVVEGKRGLFAAMPKTAGKDGRFYDSVKLLTDEAKQELQAVVLQAYNE